MPCESEAFLHPVPILIFYSLLSQKQGSLINEASRVYEKLSAFSLIPGLICIQTVMRGYLEYGHLEEGIRFFESISKSTKGDRFIMSAAVHLYKSAGNESKAEAILNSMSSMKIPFLRKLEVGSGLKTSRCT